LNTNTLILSEWILSGSWIELGRDEYDGSLIRILDIGGLLWENEKPYATVSAALVDAKTALKRILADVRRDYEGEALLGEDLMIIVV
jgi:hypothetical protein